MKVTEKAPHYTTFRRHVRRWQVPVSKDVPSDMVKELIQRDLNKRKHSVVSDSWQESDGRPDDYLIRASRTISVRYLTGGMRHGLGATIELQPGVSVVEFARAHGPGFGR